MKINKVLISCIISSLSFLGVSPVSASQSCLLPAPLNNSINAMMVQWRKSEQLPSLQISISLPRQSCVYNFFNGTTELDNTTPVTTNTIYQIGSITKPFITAIILQLEAQGKFNINDTIKDTVKKYGLWLPQKEYEAWKNITIKQLLNMTSGIYNYTNVPELHHTPVNFDRVWSNEELLDVAYTQKSVFAPGTNWGYSNTNYILLGMLISAVTQHSLDLEIQQRMLDKKGLMLTHTFYIPHAYSTTLLAKIARGYGVDGKDTTGVDMSIAGAGGAMLSTSYDITRWVRGLFGSQVLPQKQLGEMMQTVSTKTGLASDATNLNGNYGLGLFRSYSPQYGSYWNYEGGTYGYKALFLWAPRPNIVLTIMTNRIPKDKKFLENLANALVEQLLADKSLVLQQN